ncbi:MAG: flagellar export chaperone FliS [Rhodospirillales bacterium]|jgi:flagellar protein FliS|nr:flagellar export chaperone FliS [Rhodospirillales bacterium]|tara:strand:+ start:439 stop:888 length:450 start_codon:yes stop_codon:yes gene_type:complete
MENHRAPAAAYNPYAAQSIMTASPSALVVKLYDAALLNLRKTISCIEKGDITGRWQANRKTFDIIEHLTLTLNPEKGGEVAANLAELYTFILRQLILIDEKNDAETARNVIALLTPLHESWRELDRQMSAGEPASDDEVRRSERIASTA